jgi:hypothetical protein
VDATAVPGDLRGARTMFNCFHHFRPAEARRILEDAARARRPIAVFEVVSREPFTLAMLLLTVPLAVTLTMPVWRPFRWEWVLWTWIVPVMQPFVLWDGVVSWLRIYSEDELRALVATIDVPDWDWEIGRIRLGDAPAHATYLTGRPRSVPRPDAPLTDGVAAG